MSSKIGACVDHLQAFRVLCDAESFHSSATYNLTRTALLTASEAYWVLGPEDARVRIRRGLWLSDFDDSEQLNYLMQVAKIPQSYKRRVATAALAVKVRRAGIKVYAGALPGPGPTTNLDVIRWSATDLQPGLPHWAEQAAEQWRVGSGHAHGWTYAALTGAQPAAGAGRIGVVRDIQVGGNPVLAWQRYYVPFVTLQAVLRRWRELAAAPA
ncbi:hypothetical protein [Janibacter hoylei]|uniref:hypothetical protein n=1 Tax=Janibacter hoylei TaxID=364298 RepID=UPI000FE3AAB5|nr:hypothetical protein [Janibacter hoylei]